MLSLDDLIKLATSPTALLLFVLLLLGLGARGFWVFGRTYDAQVRETGEWKAIAMTATRNLDRLVSQFEKDPRRRERPAPP